MNLIENLESRQMMSVTAFLAFGQLQVYGDSGKNEIYVERTHKDGIDQLRVKDHGSTVKVTLLNNAKVSTVPVSAVNEIYVAGGGDDDKLEASCRGESAVKQTIFWYGESGNDRIKPGKGKDVVDGGTGTDQIDYSEYDADVEVRLNSNAPEASGRMGSDTDRDTLKLIENAKGGDGDDILVGNSLANKLEGGDGDDTITGGLGADDMRGNDGDDWFFCWEAIDVQDKVDGGDDLDHVVDKMLKDTTKNCELFGAAI